MIMENQAFFKERNLGSFILKFVKIFMILIKPQNGLVFLIYTLLLLLLFLLLLLVVVVVVVVVVVIVNAY